jgi:hypothetical protein
MGEDQDYYFVRHQLDNASGNQSLIPDGEYGGLKFRNNKDAGYRLEFDYSGIDTKIIVSGGDASNFWDCLIQLLKGENLERAQEKTYADGTTVTNRNLTHQLEEITNEEGLLDEEQEEDMREFMEDYKLI